MPPERWTAAGIPCHSADGGQHRGRGCRPPLPWNGDATRLSRRVPDAKLPPTAGSDARDEPAGPEVDSKRQPTKLPSPAAHLISITAVRHKGPGAATVDDRCVGRGAGEGGARVGEGRRGMRWVWSGDVCEANNKRVGRQVLACTRTVSADQAVICARWLPSQNRDVEEKRSQERVLNVKYTIIRRKGIKAQIRIHSSPAQCISRFPRLPILSRCQILRWLQEPARKDVADWYNPTGRTAFVRTSPASHHPCVSIILFRFARTSGCPCRCCHRPFVGSICLHLSHRLLRSATVCPHESALC